MPGVHGIDMEREIRSAATCQRSRRRAALDIEQLTQAMTSEISQLLHIGVKLRDLELYGLLVHGDEAHRLIRWPLHEELHLAVLIGCTQRGERRWPDPSIAVLAMFSQTFRPELNKP